MAHTASIVVHDVCFYDENGTKLGNEKVALTVGKTYIVGANDEDSDASFTIKKDAVVVPVRIIEALLLNP